MFSFRVLLVVSIMSMIVSCALTVVIFPMLSSRTQLAEDGRYTITDLGGISHATEQISDLRDTGTPNFWTLVAWADSDSYPELSSTSWDDDDDGAADRFGTMIDSPDEGIKRIAVGYVRNPREDDTPGWNVLFERDADLGKVQYFDFDSDGLFDRRHEPPSKYSFIRYEGRWVKVVDMDVALTTALLPIEKALFNVRFVDGEWIQTKD